MNKTLLDEFACVALLAILGRDRCFDHYLKGPAEMAYDYAEAMMDEKSKRCVLTDQGE